MLLKIYLAMSFLAIGLVVPFCIGLEHKLKKEYGDRLKQVNTDDIFYKIFVYLKCFVLFFLPIYHLLIICAMLFLTDELENEIKYQIEEKLKKEEEKLKKEEEKSSTEEI